MKHGLFHESCYQCLYAKSDRVSDITIADYWGIDPEFVKDKHTLNGTNLVVVHSDKGQAIWDDIKEKIESYKRPYEEAVAGNDTLRAPTDAPPDREEILRLVSDKGFEYAIRQDKVNRHNRLANKYARIISIISRLLPRSLKILIKKLRKRKFT